MKEQQFYTCKYCFKEFEPKRRRVQKFCSNTCRSKAHHARKINTSLSVQKKDGVLTTNNSNENTKMSVVGIGNATAGALAADGIKSLITKNENKPATKKDLDQLIERLNYRYHLVKNMVPNHLGQYPYYDLQKNIIVYLLQ
ncbi:hypothetical protein [Winogradskyella sp. PE311]|uniref:hypothetical protein n=1 Tax=Winogradskyella sp. PE311 TaxID=3366943 RepID=UPI00397FFAA3